jgi:serine O-acetyltransferase
MLSINEWLGVVKEDTKVFCLVHPQRGLFKYFYYPDFRVVLIFRLSQLFYSCRMVRPFSYLMTMLNDVLNGVWIGPRVSAGPGLSLAHPRGLVVNPDTIIGKNCSILQRVTIGGPQVVIGDFVSVGAGASIISNVRGRAYLTVGSHVIIGAGAVVVQDVPDCSVVVGVPAKVVKTIMPEDNWFEYMVRSQTHRI